MERLSKVTHINGAERESCLLSRSTLSSLIKLLPIAEYDLWFREMTVAGLETFVCFKKVIIERNTNKNYGPSQNLKDMSSSNTRKTVGSIHKVQCQNKESSEKDLGANVLASRESSPNSPSDFEFPCPMKGHKHES